MKKKFLPFLFIILGLAALLRFPYLNTFPPSMVQDEVGLGYSAISIAETGKDEWGNTFPLVFKSFGDYKPPAFFYATAILYKIIGWQTALPRITSAIAGVFIVLMGILWIKKIFKSVELGLIAGLVFAVSPWTVHLSRMALESNLGLAFFMAGLNFMASAKKSYLNLIAAAAFFSLSTYSYHGFRFTVILFLSGLLISKIGSNIYKFKKFHISEYIKNTAIILVLSSVLSLPGFLSKGATSRLDQTLNVNSEESKLLYENYSNNCHITFIEFNSFVSKYCNLKYNKYTRPVMIATVGLVKHLSPAFLFFTGDSSPGRNPIQQGEFFIILFPIWMIGSLISLRNYKEYFPIIVGYVISILPSTFSGDPHAIRMSIHIPFVVAVIIIGYKYLNSRIKYFSIIFILLTLIMTSNFVFTYAVDTYATNERTSTFLSYAKDIAKLSYEYAQNGYTVYADHDLYPEPHIYYAYWNKIDPKLAQESFANFYQEGSGFSRPTKFGDKVHFQEGDIKSLVCNLTYDQKTVFITNDPVDLTPQKRIQENTNTFTFAYIYELDALRANKVALLSFCNH